MLNKPKFMRPSTNKEECTVDLKANKIPFSCVVDGNESVTKWQIVIYDITNNEEVFRTEEIPLEFSFSPVDKKNRNVVFSVDLKPYVKDSVDFVNRKEAYYWTITLWGESGSVITSYQEVFYANETPTARFFYKYQNDDGYNSLTDVNTLNSRECAFKAVYVQADGVELKRYGWRIIDTDSGQVFVDTITSNQIYGNAYNMLCNYDGFLDGGNYSVELFVETQNNTKVTFPPIEFSVSYVSTFLSNDFKVDALKNEPAVMLDWNEARVISGILKNENDDVVNVGDTTFTANYPVKNQCSIEIPNGYKVVYDREESLNFDINENAYIAFSTQLLSNNTATLFFAEGSDSMGNKLARKLAYNKNMHLLTYEVEQNGIVFKAESRHVTNTPSEYVWYNILMSPILKDEYGDYFAELKVYEGIAVDCDYPSESLYPSKSLYPTFGKWNNLKEV